MNDSSKLNIEKRLVEANASLADAIDLIEKSSLLTQYACTIIATLGKELEEIYISIEENENDSIFLHDK